MTEWKIKRFWTEARVVDHPDGHTVHLDDRPVRTPAKAPLVVPTRALAEAIAAEWDAQPKIIDPGTMPVTRAANAAIDKVTPQRAEVADLLSAYGGSDLLCYRADTPETLVRRQADGWDPLIDWVADHLAAPLRVGAGVMPIAQDTATLDRLAVRVHALDPFALAAFHDLVMLSGSLVLALAVTDHRLDPETAWQLSRIDEDWQAELWGDDEEATAANAIKRAAFLDAARIYFLACS